MLNSMFGSGQRGVTLVETAVALGIIAVLAGAALPSVASRQASSRIRASADAIHAGLKLARSEAVVRNTDVMFTLQSDGGWAVGCVAVTSQCPALLHTHPGAQANGRPMLSITQLNSAAASDSSGVVMFDSRGAPDTRSTSMRQVDISMSATGPVAPQARALRITLSNFGRMRVCDPGTGAGSLPACG